MSVQSLHWADYVVTVLTLMVALGIGFFFAVFRGGQRSKVGRGRTSEGRGQAVPTLAVAIGVERNVARDRQKQRNGTPADERESPKVGGP
ncbi:hypothetical protein ACOMHN_041034 [Nucella lapillus]